MTTIQHAPVERTEQPEQRRRFVKLSEDIIRDPTLSDAAVRLYAEVGSYAWESIGSKCWASQETLARDLGWSVAKVQRAARECLRRGLITCQRTGRTNDYRPVRSITSDVSDPSPVTDLIHHQCSTNQTKEPDDPKQTPAEPRRTETCSSRSSSAETATTTTTNTASDDADVENLLDAYECAIEDETGRKPARRTGDVEAAERLLATGQVPEGDDGSMEFAQVIGWGLRDPYSRERLVGSFAAAAKCYAPLVSKFAGARTVGCAWCKETFKLAPAQARSVERGEAALCPSCDVPLSGPVCSHCERRPPAPGSEMCERCEMMSERRSQQQ